MVGIGLIVASAFLVGLGALALLVWALASGQYDDLEGDAQRILIENPED